ncbi:MAG: U32 family peptidase [Ignavibacteriota bacterium]
MAYSGQCFSSEAWGGRSANRGQCAQACRLPYELIVDGETKPLADARYLLSSGRPVRAGANSGDREDRHLGDQD